MRRGRADGDEDASGREEGAGVAGILEGRRALVTGGAHGIGRATAQAFAAAGATVAVLDTEAEADAAAAVAAAVGGLAVLADVADPAATTEAIDRAARELGGLTTVFANAGFGVSKPLEDHDDELFDRLIRVNLTGTFHTLRAVLPHLRAAGGGAIVTMAGTTALRPARGEGPYGAAKAGVIALTQEVALSHAPTIRANCVAPGYVATRLTAGVVDTPWLREHVESRIPLGRVARPEEIASVVTFLCSDGASYVTGQLLRIDGGSMLPSHQSDELIRGLVRPPSS